MNVHVKPQRSKPLLVNTPSLEERRKIALEIIKTGQINARTPAKKLGISQKTLLEWVTETAQALATGELVITKPADAKEQAEIERTRQTLDNFAKTIAKDLGFVPNRNQTMLYLIAKSGI